MRKLSVRRSVMLVPGVLTLLAGSSARLSAQDVQFDVHGSFSVSTTTHTRSWGAGLAPQFTFGAAGAPVKLSLAPGFDYLKQQGGGPHQESISLDVNLQPGGSAAFTPYAGVSASQVWSSGTGDQWEGARLGLDTMAGFQLKLGSGALSLKAEERFGYVKGQEHSFTTRLGMLAKL